jgi:single-stranded-DNA-specific exonuclease
MLYFNKTACDFLYYEGESLDIAATLSKNEYRGKVSVSVQIVDIRLSNLNFTNVLRSKAIYEKFKLNNSLSEDEINLLLPTREDFVSVYRYVKSAGDKPVRTDLLNERAFKDNKNIAKIYITLDVIEERGLADICKNGDEYKISIKNVTEKIKLNESYILESIKNRKGEI